MKRYKEDWEVKMEEGISMMPVYGVFFGLIAGRPWGALFGCFVALFVGYNSDIFFSTSNHKQQ